MTKVILMTLQIKSCIVQVMSCNYTQMSQNEIEVPLGLSVADIHKLLCDTINFFSRCHMILCTILHAPKGGFTLGDHNTKCAFYSWESNAIKMRQIHSDMASEPFAFQYLWGK